MNAMVLLLSDQWVMNQNLLPIRKQLLPWIDSLDWCVCLCVCVFIGIVILEGVFDSKLQWSVTFAISFLLIFEMSKYVYLISENVKEENEDFGEYKKHSSNVLNRMPEVQGPLEELYRCVIRKKRIKVGDKTAILSSTLRWPILTDYFSF